MERQRNRLQILKKGEISREELNEMEASNLLDIEFKVVIVRMETKVMIIRRTA